jgi:hypothetical protein
MSLSESLKELLPISSRPMTKLWASRWESHCWEGYTASGKALGELLGESLQRELLTGQVSCLLRESLGKSSG